MGTKYSNSFLAIGKQESQNAIFAKMCLENKYFSFFLKKNY